MQATFRIKLEVEKVELVTQLKAQRNEQKQKNY